MLDAARRRAIEPVATWELAEEIAEVLERPHLARYRIERRDIEDVLMLLAPLLPTVELDISPRDPDDAPVVAAAVGGNADAIVSGDNDLLGDETLRAWLREQDIAVYTPVELLEVMGLEE